MWPELLNISGILYFLFHFSSSSVGFKLPTTSEVSWPKTLFVHSCHRCYLAHDSSSSLVFAQDSSICSFLCLVMDVPQPEMVCLFPPQMVRSTDSRRRMVWEMLHFIQFILVFCVHNWLLVVNAIVNGPSFWSQRPGILMSWWRCYAFHQGAITNILKLYLCHLQAHAVPAVGKSHAYFKLQTTTYQVHVMPFYRSHIGLK